MPVINPPKLSDIYKSVNATRNATRNRSTISIQPIPAESVLKSDGNGRSAYVPGNETLYLESANLSSISSHSVTVFGPNTFTCEGKSFFNGSVFMSSIQLNSREGPVAFGYQAGAVNQGENSIAIGNYAGQLDQPANTLIFNATGAPLNIDPFEDPRKRFLVNPIRQIRTAVNISTTVLPVYWNSETNELIQGPLYNGAPQFMKLNDATVSSITRTPYADAKAIGGVSSLNNYRYIPFEILETYPQSTLRVSTLNSSDTMSTNRIEANKINGTPYIQYFPQNAFSTIATETTVAKTLNTKLLQLSTINGVEYEPYRIVSTLSTVNVSSSVNTKSVSTQELTISSINRTQYIPFYITSTFSTLNLKKAVLINPLSTQQILVSTVNTRPFQPFYIASTLSNASVSSSVLVDSLSTQRLTLSTINGIVYQPFYTVSSFSTVIADTSLTSRRLSTQELTLSTINGVEYVPYYITSTLSTTFVSGSVITASLSTQQLTLSSINRVRFQPFYIASTLSTSFVSSSVLVDSLSTQQLTLSTINGVRFQPFYIASTLSTSFVSSSVLSGSLSTQQLTLSSINGVQYEPFYIASTLSTVFADRITTKSLSTQGLRVSTIFGIPYLPELTLSTLTLSTFRVSSVTTKTLSTNSLEVRTVNGEEYNGNRNLSTFSTLGLSSLVAATTTSKDFYFVSINGGPLALPTLTYLNVSSIEVSTIFHPNILSTQQFTTSSINGTIYDPYLILSTISSVVIDGTVQGDFLTSGDLSTVQLSTGSIQGSATTLESFTANAISTAQIVAESAARISSINGSDVSTSQLTGGVVRLNSLSTNQVSTAFVTGGVATIPEISTARVSGGSIVGTTFTVPSISTNALFASSIFAGTIYASTVTILINTTCTTTRVTNTIVSANVEYVSSLQMFGNRGDYSVMTATTLSTGATSIGGPGQLDVLSTNQISTGLLLGGIVKGLTTLSTISLSTGSIQGSSVNLTSFSTNQISSGSTQGHTITFSTLSANTMSTQSIQGEQLSISSFNTNTISTSLLQGGLLTCSSASTNQLTTSSIQGGQATFRGVSTNTVTVSMTMQGGSLGSFDTLSTVQISTGTLRSDSLVEFSTLNAGQISTVSVVCTALRVSSLSTTQLTTSSILGLSFSMFSTLSTGQVSTGSIMATRGLFNSLSTNQISVGRSLVGSSAALSTLSTQQLSTGSIVSMSAVVSSLNTTGELVVSSIRGSVNSLVSVTRLSTSQVSTGTIDGLSSIFQSVTTQQLSTGFSVAGQASFSLLSTNQLSSGSIRGNLVTLKMFSTSQITTGSVVGEKVVFNDIARDTNLTIAVGQDTATTKTSSILYSYDGSNWSNVIDTPFTYGLSVAHNGIGTWVAVGTPITGRSNIQWSTNGSNWNNANSIQTQITNTYGIAYGLCNGVSPMWVATGFSSGGANSILTSTDASNWYKPTSIGIQAEFQIGIAYGLCNGTTPIWVVNGTQNSGNSRWLATTRDPTGSWLGNANIPFQVASTAYSPAKSLWVLGSSTQPSNGSTVYYTSDPTATWSIASSYSGSGRYVYVSWANEYFFAVSSNSSSSNHIQRSTDGITWTAANYGDGIPGGLESSGSVGWNGSVYIAMGGGPAKLVYSADGCNWSNSSGSRFSGLSGLKIANLFKVEGVTTADSVSTSSVLGGSATYQVLNTNNLSTGSFVANNALIDSLSTSQISTSSTRADFTSFQTFSTNNISTTSANVGSASLSSFVTNTISSGFAQVAYGSTVAFQISSINGYKYGQVASQDFTVSSLLLSSLFSHNTVSTAGLVVGFLNGQRYNPNEVISTFSTFTASTIAANRTSTLSLEVSFINGSPYFPQVYQTEASTVLVSSILTTRIASTLNMDLYTINGTVYQVGSNITDIIVARVTNATRASYLSTPIISTTTFNADSTTVSTLNTSSISTGFINARTISTGRFFTTYINDLLYSAAFQPSTFSTFLNSSIRGHNASYSTLSTVGLSTVSLTTTRFAAFSATSTTQLSTGLILGGLLDSGNNLSTTTISSGNTVGTLLRTSGQLTASGISTNTVTVAQLYVSTLNIELQSSASIVVRDTVTTDQRPFDVKFLSTVSTYAVYGEFNSLTLGSLSTGFLRGGDARLNSLSTNVISTGSITNASGVSITSISTGSVTVRSIQGLANTSYVTTGLSTGQISTGSVVGTTMTLSGLSTGTLSIGPVEGSSGSFSRMKLVTAATTTTRTLLVAVGSMTTAAGTIQYSTDGSNWLNATGGFNGASKVGYGVAYNGSNRWVAVGYGDSAANSIQTSTDGSNWFDTSSGGFTNNTSNIGYKVRYANNLWVAVGYGGTAENALQNSTDGLTWTNATSVTFSTGGWQNSLYNVYDVAWGSNPTTGCNAWVAAISGYPCALYSFDASTWVAVNANTARGGNVANAVTYDVRNDRWMIGSIGDNSSLLVVTMNTVYSSSSWPIASNFTPAVTAGIYAITSFPTTTIHPSGMNFLSAGSTTSNNTILYSSNSFSDSISLSATIKCSFASASLGIVFDGNNYYAVGDGSDAFSTIMKSTDGTNWLPTIVSGGFNGTTYRITNRTITNPTAVGIAARPESTTITESLTALVLQTVNAGAARFTSLSTGSITAGFIQASNVAFSAASLSTSQLSTASFTAFGLTLSTLSTIGITNGSIQGAFAAMRSLSTISTISSGSITGGAATFRSISTGSISTGSVQAGPSRFTSLSTGSISTGFLSSLSGTFLGISTGTILTAGPVQTSNSVTLTGLSTSQISTGPIVVQGFGIFASLSTGSLSTFGPVQSGPVRLESLNTGAISTTSVVGLSTLLASVSVGTISSGSVQVGQATVSTVSLLAATATQLTQDGPARLTSLSTNTISTGSVLGGPARFTTFSTGQVSTGSVVGTQSWATTFVSISTSQLSTGSILGGPVTLTSLSTLQVSTAFITGTSTSFTVLSTGVLNTFITSIQLSNTALFTSMSTGTISTMSLIAQQAAIFTSMSTGTVSSLGQLQSGFVTTASLSTGIISTTAIVGQGLSTFGSTSTGTLSTFGVQSGSVTLSSFTTNTISTGSVIGSGPSLFTSLSTNIISTMSTLVEGGIFIGLSTTSLSTGFVGGGPARFTSLSTNTISTGFLGAASTIVSSIQITSILSTGSITGLSTSLSTVIISSINGFRYTDPSVRTINNSTFVSSFVTTLSTLLTGSLSTLSTVATVGNFLTLSTISSISSGFINTRIVSTRTLLVSTSLYPSIEDDGTFYQYPSSAIFSTFVNVSNSLLTRNISTLEPPPQNYAYNTVPMVAVGQGTAGEPKTTIQYSYDGVNWTNINSGGFNNAVITPNLSATGNNVIFVPDYGIAYSPSRNLWVAITAMTGTIFNEAADKRSTIQYSTDGSNWKNANTISSGYFNCAGNIGSAGRNGRYIATNDMGMWVIVNSSGINLASTMIYSTDGSNWNKIINNIDSAYQRPLIVPGSLSFGYSNRSTANPLWTAAGVTLGGNGTQSNAFLQSTDGITWSNSPWSGPASSGVYSGGIPSILSNAMPSGVSLKLVASLTYSPVSSNWILCGQNGTANTIFYSTDFNSWSQPTNCNLIVNGGLNYNVNWSYDRFLMTSVNTIIQSTDGSSLSYLDEFAPSTNTIFTVRSPIGVLEGSKYITLTDESATAPNTKQGLSTIKVSADGSNWNNIQSGGIPGITRIATVPYFYGYMNTGVPMVATGRGTPGSSLDSIQYSYDGILWKNIQSGGFTPVNNTTSSIIYSVATNEYNLWVAVGTNGSNSTVNGSRIRFTPIYSTDGINWSEPTITSGVTGIGYPIGLASYTRTIGYGDGIWLVGGNQFNDNLPGDLWGCVSSDGSNWTNCMPNPGTFAGGSIFTTFGYSNRVCTNPIWVVGMITGITFICNKNTVAEISLSNNWTANRNTIPYPLKGVAFSRDNYNWVRITSNITVQYSTDFATSSWTDSLDVESLTGMPKAFWVYDRFFISGSNTGVYGNCIQQSTDGSNFTMFSSNLPFEITDITQTFIQSPNVNFIITGNGTGNNQTSILVSADGSSFTPIQVGGFPSTFSIASIPYKANLYQSLTGSHRANALIGPTTTSGTAGSGSLLVAVGSMTGAIGSTIQYSTDGGLNWRGAVTGGFSNNIGYGVAYNGSNRWVAVGYGSSAVNSIQTSTDGSNWTNATSGGFTNNIGYKVRYANNTWVAVGSGGTSNNALQKSIDGLNWNNATSVIYNTPYPITPVYDVAWGSNPTTGCNAWVAAITGYPCALYSFDASTWNRVPSDISRGGNVANAVTYDVRNDRWIIGSTQNSDSLLSGPMSNAYTTNGWNSPSFTPVVSPGIYAITSFPTTTIHPSGMNFLSAGSSASNNTILYSDNSVTSWTATIRCSFASASLGIVFDGNNYYAVGDGSHAFSTIMKSTDGTNWLPIIVSGGFNGTTYSFAGKTIANRTAVGIAARPGIAATQTTQNMLSLNTYTISTNTLNNRTGPSNFPLVQYGSNVLSNTGITIISFNPDYTVPPSVTVTGFDSRLSNVVFALSNVTTASASIYHYSTLTGALFRPTIASSYEFNWISMGY